MREDVAALLISMGYVAEVQFRASSIGPGNVSVTPLDGTVLPTEAEIDAFALGNPNAFETFVTQQDRTQASVALNDNRAPSWKVLRAVAAVLVDEINALRQRDRDRSADVAAATNLADLKTRWAARSTLADRTMAQAKTAIQTTIAAGTVD